MREFRDGEIDRKAGDEWLIEGPMMYQPRIEEDFDSLIEPKLIQVNTALKLRARRACTDANGVERKDGEEWLIREPGFYLP